MQTKTAALVDGRTAEQAAAEAHALLVKARMHVAVFHCFFGALLERLKLKCDPRHPTMYTDAVVIGYSPQFVLSLTFGALVYIMIHEVLHCALGHPFRRGNRDAKLWNIACDYVVNAIINRDPELRKLMPSDAQYDAQYDGMAAEQVYAILAQQQQQQQQQQPDESNSDDDKGNDLSGSTGEAGDCLDAGASGERSDDDSDDDSDDSDADSDSEPSDEAGDESGDEDSDESGEADSDASRGDSDDAEDGDGSGQSDGAGEESDERTPQGSMLDAAELAELEEQWAEACMTAQLAAGGEVDSKTLRSITDSNAQVKSFEEHIDDFANRACNSEDSWARSNRRYADTYLPARCAPGVQLLVVGIDTSGSIGDEALSKMQVAAQRIMDDFGLKELHVVYCDTRIHGVQIFTQGDQVVFEQVNGGGGTYFHPVLRYALEQQQQGEDIAGVIYLTDLAGSVRDAEDFTDLEVLWVNVEPRTWRSNEAPAGLGKVCNINH